MKTLILLSLLSTLSACTTPYKRSGLMGGYEDMKLSEGIYQVSFRGNGYTDQATVQKFMLRRCAEVTIENQYDYFVFIDRDNQSATQDLGTTFHATTTGGNGIYNTNGTMQHNSVTRHLSSAMIRMFKTGQQPQLAFSAEDILKNFGVKVVNIEDDRDPASISKDGSQ